MTVLLLVFGEYVPTAWFRARPLDRSARFARLLRASWILLRPIAATASWLAGLLLPRKATARKSLCDALTREELILLTTEVQRHGVLSPGERAMIHNVFSSPRRRPAAS